MSKKTWILISCLVLSLAMGLGGSLAYLTDRDAVVNTFTMGNVDIEVEENFPDPELKPGVDVTKEAKITNTSSNPALVWMTVAVPADMDDYIELTWNADDDYNALLGFPHDVDEEGNEIPGTDYDWFYTAMGEDGKEYHVYTQFVFGQLPGEESTEDLLLSVTLNEYVDVIDGVYYHIEGGEKIEIPNPNDMKIVVTGHAIQVDGFDNIEEAYAAYGQQWGEMVVETEANGGGDNWPEQEPTVFTESTTVEAIIRLENNDPNATDCVTAAGEGVVVEIIDGRYHIGNNYGPCAVWAKDGATVKIMSGEYACEARNDLDANTHVDLIYAGSGADKTYGRIEIYGGAFMAWGSTPENPGAWLLNENDTYGEIVVYGGMFLNWNPADNESEGPHTNFLAEGYTVRTENDENGNVWYYVEKE